MARATERSRQYANRAWQCQKFYVSLSFNGHHSYRHVCQLLRDHYGPCQCWCDCLFDDVGVVLVQGGLWGVSRTEYVHGS